MQNVEGRQKKSIESWDGLCAVGVSRWNREIGRWGRGLERGEEGESGQCPVRGRWREFFSTKITGEVALYMLVEGGSAARSCVGGRQKIIAGSMVEGEKE